MKSSLLMNFNVDKENNKIVIERGFAAPVSDVWDAWTKPHLLDQWWAPKPWKASTKTMDFREGGHWIYAMLGPEGEEHWARADFEAITPGKMFSSKDAFCDPDGKVNTELPMAFWKNEFSGKNGSTIVRIEITYGSAEELENYLKMGFREGFLAALENLDELLKA